MARLDIKGSQELEIALSRMADPEITKEVVWAGAQPVADEIRKGLEKNLQGSKYSEGDLLDSLGIAPPGIDKHGNTNTKIGFSGYNRKGVPNALKARVMESGTSRHRKRPFIRPAVNRSREKAIQAMQNMLNRKVNAVFKTNKYRDGN